MSVAYYIGANTGRHCEDFSKVYDKVIAIEPNPVSYDKLVDRCKNIKNVICINKAVSNSKKSIDFFIPDNPMKSEVATCNMSWVEGKFKRVFDEGYSKIEVSSTTLKELFSTHGEPNLIKLDVEGYERPIIETLEKKYIGCKVIFEWSSELRIDAARCLQHLEKLGWGACQILRGDNPINLSGDFRDWMSMYDGMVYLLKHPTPKISGEWGDVYAT